MKRAYNTRMHFMDMIKITAVLSLLTVSASIMAQVEVECKDFDEFAYYEALAHEKAIQFRSNVLTQDYNVVYQRMEWEVDPSERYIKGSVFTRFIVLEGEFDRINFDLAGNMTVNSVTFHGEELSDYKFIGDNLEIVLPEVLEPGKEDSITIDYEGAPGNGGFGYF